jgi:cytoskeleton protein RodZ
VPDDLTTPEGEPSVPSVPLGPALTAAREARGLSVEDVAAATRIRATLIRAIESDDFSRSGGAVYARGHIKSIAQVVGADARELVAEFDRRNGESVPGMTPSPLPAFEASPDYARASNPSARWASLAIAVLAVATVFLGASWLLGRGGEDPGQQATEPESGAPSASATPSTPPPTSSAPATTTPAPPATPRGVRLRVQAKDGPSWLLVTSSSGSQLFMGTLGTGESREFRDSRLLTVKFGNAPVVTLTLNGRDVGAPRCGRIVCSMEFDAKAAAG